MDIIIERWRRVLDLIEKRRAASPLAAKAVTLIAVTKAQPAEAILSLLEVGQRDFGENRVQEAQTKWPPLIARYPGVRLHLIGSLQTNKVREALLLFNSVQSVDRVGLVDAIKNGCELQVAGCGQFFVQVNTGEEPQKGGVLPQDLPALMEHIHHLQHATRNPQLTISGLMCVPPAGTPPAPHFALLHKLAQEYGLRSLSMGMSGDFETAVRLGATHVRVGTAIFGERI